MPLPLKNYFLRQVLICINNFLIRHFDRGNRKKSTSLQHFSKFLLTHFIFTTLHSFPAGGRQRTNEGHSLTDRQVVKSTTKMKKMSRYMECNVEFDAPTFCHTKISMLIFFINTPFSSK